MHECSSSGSGAPYLTIVLPVKDGEERLGETLDEVLRFIASEPRPCEVIAVDDGSRDRTPEILRDYSSRHPCIRVLTHPHNRGKGAALRSGAEASRGEFLLALDADSSYAVRSVSSFIQALENGADAALGNRRDPRTRFTLHPRHFGYIGLRHALGWIFNRVARRVVGIGVHDSQCGFKCLRGEIAREVFAKVRADRFSFDVELVSRLEGEQRAIVELPVLYTYREQKSTVQLVRDGRQMLRELLRIRREARRGRP
ncbi:MAG: glycosyltransferase family 2 protein [Myxococcota bacterium]